MERSIPPETITNISPTALIVIKDICLIMSLKLLKVRKLGAMNENRTTAASNINKGVYFLMIVLKFLDKVLESEGGFFISVPCIHKCIFLILIKLILGKIPKNHLILD